VIALASSVLPLQYDTQSYDIMTQLSKTKLSDTPRSPKCHSTQVIDAYMGVSHMYKGLGRVDQHLHSILVGA
jgi:hypothetical protein